MELIQRIDEYLFRLINSYGFELMDTIMRLVSNKFFWIPLYLYLIYLIYKNFSKNFFKILFSISIVIFLADFGSVHLFKEIFERPRPCHILEDIRLVDGCGGPFGFISSHASNSFALAFFFGLIFRNRQMFLLLFSWAIIIGFSRVYLGVHYPFDILGGIFWGLFVSLLIYKLYIRKVK